MTIKQAGYTATLQPTTPDTAGGVIVIQQSSPETLGQQAVIVDAVNDVHSASVWAYVTHGQTTRYKAVIRDTTDGSYLAHTDFVFTTAGAGWINLPIIAGAITTQNVSIFLYTEAQATQPWSITRHNSGSGSGNKHQDANADEIYADPENTAITGWVTTANDFSIYLEYSDVPLSTDVTIAPTGLVDGTYRVVLHDATNTEVHNADVVFASGTATITLTGFDAGALFTGFVIDNEAPHVDGAVISVTGA